MALCTLCETRKPRRYCPGIRADICAPCCGTEREVTVDCPLDCEYLVEARRHERETAEGDAPLPNADIQVTEEFVRTNDALVILIGHLLAEASLETQGAVDVDAREALEALIRTHRTLDTGLIYETRPANPFAAEIQTRFQDSLASVREDMAKEQGFHSIRDSHVLPVLVFFQRIELRTSNGRRRGRAFIDFLRRFRGRKTPVDSIIAP